MAVTPQVATTRVAIARVVVALALAFIGTMTLVPIPGGSPTARPLCLVCGDRGGTDLLLNVLLFTPLGAGLALLGVRTTRVVLAAAAVAAVVELLQLTVVTGRDPAVGDVVNNAAGALAGALLARHRRVLLRPDGRAAVRLAVGGALAWLALLGVTAFAMRPAATDADYFGQLRPDRPRQWDRFAGDVLAASAGGAALADGRMPAAQAAALRRAVALAVRIAPPADAPPRLAPIVAVVDGRREEIGLLAQRGDALLFRSRTGAATLRLTAPELALPGIFRVRDRPGCAAEGAPLDIRASIAPGAMTLAVGGACARARTAAMRVSDGWMLAMPFRWDHGPLTLPFRVAWLVGLVAPWSFWAARAARATRPLGPAVLVATALGVGLVVVPRLAGLPAGTWWEWGAALAGVLAGWAAAWSRRYHR